ncbi:MAG: hypothetical protein CSB21_02930 [Deltaproteobacteria bacterium]|nr:MAG: hypothetical protein CSB21_02930 [Deltaproteobacteria bacterium]
MIKKSVYKKIPYENKIDIFSFDLETSKIKFEKGFEIWKCQVSKLKKDMEFFAGFLSSDEVKKARSLKIENDRLLFIISRSILRFLISGYLEKEPDKICFSYGDKGKPEIILSKDEPYFSFNLSHSGDIILICFSKFSHCGIDVEKFRKIKNFKLIVQKYFHSEEKDFLNCLPRNLQEDMFFKIWTLKEAYIKAHGLGAGKSFESFSVFLNKLQNSNFFSFEPEKGYFGGAFF